MSGILVIVVVCNPRVVGDEEYDLQTKFFILDCESYSFLSLSFYLTSIGLYPDFIFSLSVDKVETLISNYFYK